MSKNKDGKPETDKTAPYQKVEDKIRLKHKRKNIMKNESKIISGFILGALAGGALGVLFAPSAGKRTRIKLKKNTKRLVDDAKDTLLNAADDAVAKVNDGNQELSSKVPNQ